MLLVSLVIGCQRRDRRVEIDQTAAKEVAKIEAEKSPKTSEPNVTAVADTTKPLSGGEAAIPKAKETPRISGEASIPPSPPAPARPNEGELAEKFVQDFVEWNYTGILEYPTSRDFAVKGRRSFTLWFIDTKGEKIGSGQTGVITSRTKGDLADLAKKGKVNLKAKVKYYDLGETESYYDVLSLEVTPVE